ncbi:hypothetical protein JOQ06_017417 [Pogonophryne albipinna]|uniref:Uncharacterized protein n=1 Tax=Pogonophryne albipinna TaxID=1090488 RepID=A0AAD6B157_9TELE|nr:hypothetical protein JOQ06_017417 [Pogonophryne albipinna]
MPTDPSVRPKAGEMERTCFLWPSGCPAAGCPRVQLLDVPVSSCWMSPCPAAVNQTPRNMWRGGPVDAGPVIFIRLLCTMAEYGLPSSPPLCRKAVTGSTNS